MPLVNLDTQVKYSLMLIYYFALDHYLWFLSLVVLDGSLENVYNVISSISHQRFQFIIYIYMYIVTQCDSFIWSKLSFFDSSNNISTSASIYCCVKSLKGNLKFYQFCAIVILIRQIPCCCRSKLLMHLPPFVHFVWKEVNNRRNVSHICLIYNISFFCLQHRNIMMG